jgi:hypothetical protein
LRGNSQSILKGVPLAYDEIPSKFGRVQECSLQKSNISSFLKNFAELECQIPL